MATRRTLRTALQAASVEGVGEADDHLSVSSGCVAETWMKIEQDPKRAVLFQIHILHFADCWSINHRALGDARHCFFPRR
jgi:hypothetical protein